MDELIINHFWLILGLWAATGLFGWVILWMKGVLNHSSGLNGYYYAFTDALTAALFGPITLLFAVWE